LKKYNRSIGRIAPNVIRIGRRYSLNKCSHGSRIEAVACCATSFGRLLLFRGEEGTA
jgi:hypothetical protein